MVRIKKFTVNPFQENSYVIYNESGDAIIIDPGFYQDDEKEDLMQFIIQGKLNPVQLLNTHAHLDHIFGNKFVCDAFGLTPYMHELELETHEKAATIGLMYNLPFDSFVGKPKTLDENGVINLGEDRLSIHYLPGHSAGSIAFYCEKQHFIISGDVLFEGSIGRTDLPGGNYNTLMHSIKEKLFLLPDETIVYSGHGPETTIGEEKRSNPFLID
jgi:glyoxylase-like metal-dependent hydrolase (beta-lactamase superfamily II)